jgi:hypothetical protein
MPRGERMMLIRIYKGADGAESMQVVIPEFSPLRDP